ncbi:MAG: LLM class flavin-dependent oxidoreductase, partial [Nitrososphaerales archaeon]
MKFVLDNLLLDSMNLSSPDLLRAASESIRFGIKKIWITEGSERDSFGILSGIAPYCVGMGVDIGTNLTNVYSRTPLLIAMSCITLSEITGNHFFLTIGTGGIGYVEKCHGQKFDLP